MMRNEDCNCKYGWHQKPPVCGDCHAPCATARIYRGAAPKCPIEASIPLVEVATEEDIKTLFNCFVHVLANNKTFYIDSKHRFILCWAGDLYLDDYDVESNPLKLRAQKVVDFKNKKVTYFNNIGEHMSASLEGGE